MTLLTRAAIGVRHAIKRLIFPRLPQGLQEAMDRRFYYRRFAGGDLSWEPELRLLRELVQPGELAIDVGANLGGYSIELSRLVGPLGEVRAFEPVERTFRLLNYNLGRLGAHHNYRTYLCAVGDRTGTANMYVPLEGSLPNYYVASLRAPRDRAVTQRVELVRLDDAVTASPRRIALVKIDVEGSEYSVLLGAEHLLRTHEPSVICEVSRAPGEHLAIGRRPYSGSSNDSRTPRSATATADLFQLMAWTMITIPTTSSSLSRESAASLAC